MIDALLAELNLQEKCSLLSGLDTWHLPGVDRVGIGSLRMTDGPNGARGQLFVGGPLAVCYPSGSALGASFDPDLVQRLAESLAREAQRRGAQILLGPTVNLQRVPLAGRNFECYSEDPLLTSRLVAASVAGLQSQGIAACVKHFVCNDQETHRMTVSAEVSDIALHEVYLRPFEAAVGAGAWSIMSSYNSVNGVPAAQNRLLDEVLRQQWGFDGVVISDWHALKEVVAPLVAGTDIEMPGPGVVRGGALVQAVESGAVCKDQVDACARRVLLLLERTGRLGQPEPLGPEISKDDPNDRLLLRRAAADSSVLMHNDGLLPITEPIDRLAVIGPNADPGEIQGGGSAKVQPHAWVTPLEGLGTRAREVRHSAGVDISRFSPVLGSDGCLTPHGDPGVLAELIDEQGRVVKQRTQEKFEAAYNGPGISAGCNRGRWTTIYTPERDGAHVFGFIAAGAARFYVNGELQLEVLADHVAGAWLLGAGCPEMFFHADLSAGEAYILRVDFDRDERALGGVRLGVRAPSETSLLDEAVGLARWSEVSVVVVGMTSEWETEGKDRDDMQLPGAQVELIEAVAAVCEKTVVVLNVGAPVDVTWLRDVNAVLCVWYPGQEFGGALADVISGVSCPGGRLAQTWPVRVEDHPAIDGFPGTREQVWYSEGTAIGYRSFEADDIVPALPFGYGLSYGEPTFTDVVWAVAANQVTATVSSHNDSDSDAVAVWQLYLREQWDNGDWSAKELVDFAKVKYSGAQDSEIQLIAAAEALRVWDGRWVGRRGALELVIGRSATDELASVVLAPGRVRLGS
ncbi:MAG: glycoside hydrolase family 3 C-terminal domain-containing protein [Acidimicrobiales bacterium]